MEWLRKKCDEHNRKFAPYFIWTPETWLRSIVCDSILGLMLIIISILMKSVGGLIISIVLFVILFVWHFYDLLKG
jgi:hypothetical protein